MRILRLFLFISVLFLFGGLPMVRAADLCEQVFVSTRPFSVSSPNFMGRMLGRVLYKSNLGTSYLKVLPLARSSQDFVDLFASFNENGVDVKAQKKLLKSHPSFRSFQINDKMIDSYVSSYNFAFLKSLIRDIDSPLYNEIYSPKIVDQCSTGTCWINAATSVLESNLKLKERPDISEQYLYIQTLIERAKESAFQGKSIYDGGNMYEYMALIQNKGYVEKKDWRPRYDVYDNREKLVRPLTKLVSNYKTYLKYYRSSKDLQKKFIEDAEAIVERIVGPLPAEKFIKSIPEDLSLTFLHRDRDKVGNIDNALVEIARLIDEGNEVIIVLQSPNKDYSSKKLVQFPSPGKVDGSHGMAVVGYIKDAYGRVKVLKIKNSWGKSAGVGGYIYVTDFFLQQTFRYAAVLNQNSVN